MKDPLQLLRKLLLIANGLVFAWFAISTTVDFDYTSAFYALSPIGIGGYDEFRAVFMGFWLGLTVLFFQAVRRYHVAIVGDLAFMLVLFQSLARLYSFAVDGIPPTRFVMFFFLECGSALIGLMIRPHGVQLHWDDPEDIDRPSTWWFLNRRT